VLERFDRRIACVRHVGVHAGCARPPRSRPLPAADKDVVHRPLARRADEIGNGLRERAEDRVADALGTLDVPGADRSRCPRVDDGARVRDDAQSPPAPRVDGDVLRHQTPHHETRGAHRDGTRRVHAAPGLRIAVREIDHHTVVGDAERAADRDRTAPRAVVVQVVRERPLAARQTLEGGAHARVCVVGERALRVVEEVEAPRVRDLHEPDAATVVRTSLGEQVTLTLVGGTRRLQHEVEDLTLEVAASVEQRG
jgi:hypothetical protein